MCTSDIIMPYVPIETKVVPLPVIQERVVTEDPPDIDPAEESDPLKHSDYEEPSEDYEGTLSTALARFKERSTPQQEWNWMRDKFPEFFESWQEVHAGQLLRRRERRKSRECSKLRPTSPPNK